MRTLFLDIETSPHEVYSFELRNAFISPSQIIRPSRILCYSQAVDDEKPRSRGEWHANYLRPIYEELCKADAVVHYNGKRFDELHLNRAFLQEGWDPPSSFVTIDLYRTIKARFRFASSKLEQVVRELDLRIEKLHTDFYLWRGVMDGDAAAKRRMIEYNERDVELLQVLYAELKPWVVQHPNVAVIDGLAQGCTRCGSTNLAKNGFTYTSASTFQRYRCKDCGAESRATKRERTTELRPVASA